MIQSLWSKALQSALLAAALLPTFATPVAAQTYPARPVRVIVPYPTGGVLDTATRAVTTRLQAQLGQPFVVENLAGASGNIGLAQCARARPDGYTLCVTTNDSISVNPFLFDKMPFNPQKDLQPVQRLVWVDGVVFASSASGFRSLADLTAAARARPGVVAWGSFGNGSTGHLYLSSVNESAKVELLHVPYKGSAALLQAALGGEVQSGMLASGILAPHLKAGALVPLAVTGAKRLEAYPNVPTLAETGNTFEIAPWFGVFAPMGTPLPLVEQLNQEIARAAGDPALVRDVWSVQGMRVAPLPVAEFTQFLKRDRDNAEKLVKLSGIKLD